MRYGSYRLSESQKAHLDALAGDNRQQPDHGMSKWEIRFADGSHSTMLSDLCRDRVSAFLGAIERFGEKVVDVY